MSKATDTKKPKPSALGKPPRMPRRPAIQVVQGPNGTVSVIVRRRASSKGEPSILERKLIRGFGATSFKAMRIAERLIAAGLERIRRDPNRRELLPRGVTLRLDPAEPHIDPVAHDPTLREIEERRERYRRLADELTRLRASAVEEPGEAEAELDDIPRTRLREPKL
jgi:hypothetical protein